jgi:hypothetical protein
MNKRRINKRIIHCRDWDMTLGAHGLNSEEAYQMGYCKYIYDQSD